jgi:LytS/YehU family sensor histidine kinase
MMQITRPNLNNHRENGHAIPEFYETRGMEEGNAIKHNIISRHSPLKITVDVEQDQVLVVKNNLQPKPQPEVSTQIGLYNIVERYRLDDN